MGVRGGGFLKAPRSVGCSSSSNPACGAAEVASQGLTEPHTLVYAQHLHHRSHMPEFQIGAKYENFFINLRTMRFF